MLSATFQYVQYASSQLRDDGAYVFSVAVLLLTLANEGNYQLRLVWPTCAPGWALTLDPRISRDWKPSFKRIYYSTS